MAACDREKIVYEKSSICFKQKHTPKLVELGFGIDLDGCALQPIGHRHSDLLDRLREHVMASGLELEWRVCSGQQPRRGHGSF